MSANVGNIYSQVNKRPTIYDGKGHYEYPYSTDSSKNHYHINRRWLRFHAYFFTQNGGYDAYYALGRRDVSNKGNLTTPGNESEFSQELMGFDTKNTGSQDIPTMQIYLFAYRDWEQILQPNDYAVIQVEELYPDDPDWSENESADFNKLHDYNGIKKRTLMCGLISDVQLSEDSQKGRTYVVTCQGMEKILNDVYLGLPRTAQAQGTNLLFDINGESNPANETFNFYSSGSGSTTNTSSKSTPKGSAKEIGNKVEKGIISWCNSKGLNKNQTAGILGNCQAESTMGEASNGDNYLGISYNNNGDNTSGAGTDLSKYMNYFISHEGKYGPSSTWSKYKSMRSASAYKCGYWWGKYEEVDSAGNNPTRGSYAENIVKKL